LAAGFAVTMTAAAQPGRAPFLIGTWGVNGTLIPFAEFDGITPVDEQFVFFEASRTISRPRYAENLVMQGWLWRRAADADFQLVAVEVATRDNDGKGMPTVHPLGVVRENRRHVWVRSEGAYAHSALTVIDVRRGGVKELLRVDYPGC
jgi:hypothetical protein